MKKLLACILVGAMLLTLMIFPASMTTDVWDGSADTSWYNDTDTTFTLTTAGQLAGLAQLVNGGNTFAGKKIVLGADIDLDNKGWTPIGFGGESFSGTFDGQGHIVSNLKNINHNSNNGDWGNAQNTVGFFGQVYQATIKNFGIVGASIATGAGNGVGVLAGVANESVVENCYVMNATVIGHVNLGGMIGQLGSNSAVCRCYAVNITFTAGTTGYATLIGGPTNGAVGSVVENCYGVSNQENLIGSAAATATNSFYQAAVPGGTDTAGAVAKTEAEMKSAEFVTALNQGITGSIVYEAVENLYPVLVERELPYDDWDGDVDTSWYNDTDTTFTLTTAEQLAGLAALVNAGNSFADKTIVLGKDIDLDNKAWTPIGFGGASFSGTFDGQGHIVSNLTNINYNPNKDDWGNYQDTVGFFGQVYQATIKNFGIVGASIAPGAANGVGVLAGVAVESVVENCYVMNATVIGHVNVGGMIGKLGSNSAVRRCYAVGVTLTANTGYATLIGGPAPDAVGSVVENCYGVSNEENLIGNAAATVTNSFYQAAVSGGTDTAGAVAKTEAEMKSAEFVTALNNQNQGEMFFVAVDGDYPTLVVPDYIANITTTFENVTVDQEMTVTINANDKAFASGEITLTYDTALSFVGTETTDNVDVKDNGNGTVTITFYGDSKSAINVKFKGETEKEDAKVTLTYAAFGEAETAAIENLTKAELGTTSVTVDVLAKFFSVVLPEGLETADGVTGSITVKDGTTLKFQVTDAYDFLYKDFTVQVGEEELTADGDGYYSITVTDNIDNITFTPGTPESFSVKLGDAEPVAGAATYLTDYKWKLPYTAATDFEDGSKTNVTGVTIGGVTYNGYTVSGENENDATLIIPGADIKGDIVVTYETEAIPANKWNVLVNGTGAGAAEGYVTSVNKGGEYTLTIMAAPSGYKYMVTATMGGADVTFDASTATTFTINAVTGDVVFTIAKEVLSDVKVYDNGDDEKVYLRLDNEYGLSLYLVINDVAWQEGIVYTYTSIYGGTADMFWSEKYDAYCVLVPSISAADAITGTVAVKDGTTKEIVYNYDVNMATPEVVVDANDAQLVYNLYNTMYSEFTADVTMEKVLRADVNADGKINVDDAAAIVA